MERKAIESNRYSLINGAVLEKERSIPISGKYDVIVGGGGVAGIAAAVAAARNGAKTLLVERFGFLGGVATAGLMYMAYAPFHSTSGIIREIYLKMIDQGSGIDDVLMPFDAEQFKYLALSLSVDAGVEFLFHSIIVDAVVSEDCIKGIVIENKSGRTAILSDVVVDTTGDGDIAAQAGAAFVKGREQDGKTRPMTLLFRMGGLDVEEIIQYVNENPSDFSRDPYKNVIRPEKGFCRVIGFFSLIEEAKKMGKLDPALHYVRLECLSPKTGLSMINTTRVYGLDGTDAFDITKGEVIARRQMMQLVEVFRKTFPGFKNSFLIDSAPMLGVRETRHILGDYLLTEKDVADKTRFERIVARNVVRVTPGVDVHSPDGMEGSKQDARHRNFVDDLFWHGVPYDCLLPAGIEGLLVGGRCISASHEADKWIRVQTCCMATGQAAGTAAALSAGHRVFPRKLDVSELQNVLRSQDVVLDF